MNQPKVSVIIPVYNTEKYLRECLDSVVNQTLKDIEIICVDDGSTDASRAILEAYQREDPRVTVLHQPNRGPSAARNSGMEFAQGMFISFVDSDDLLVENTLEAAFKIAEETELDILVFEKEVFYESDYLAKKRPFHYPPVSEATEVMNGVQYLKFSKDQGIYAENAVSTLLRRAFLDEHSIAFKEGIIHEDNLFSFQAFMAANRVKRIPDKFYLRRVRESSIMTSPKSAKSVSGYFSCSIGVMKYALNNADPEKEQEIKREYSRMLGAARYVYNAISDEEKEKIFFVSEIETELFNQLIKDPARSVASDEQQKKRADRLQYDLDCVHNSVSFRLGRGITWLPRKLRGGVQCLREHGAGYTFRRILYHIGLWKDEESQRKQDEI